MFGEPGLADDPEIDTMAKRFDPVVAETRVKPILERWFSAYTKAELEAMAGDRIPLSAIKTIAEVVDDPHIAAREMIVSVPVAGQLVRMFGLPVKLSGTPGNPFGKAPQPGEHNAFVYARLAGLTPEEVARLAGIGVI
jgi:CoA:oxalate CoA-transferase